MRFASGKLPRQSDPIRFVVAYFNGDKRLNEEKRRAISLFQLLAMHHMQLRSRVRNGGFCHERSFINGIF